MYVNKAIVYGALGKDPELKALPGGQSVVSFSMATTSTWKDANGVKQEDTQWHNIVCFGKRADVLAQYVKKGDKLFVEGRMQTRSWEKDNVKHYRTEVVVDDFQFGDRKASDGGGSGAGYSQAPAQSAPANKASHATPEAIAYPTEEINPDDIPF